MTPWVARYLLRMFAIYGLMLVVELLSYWLRRQFGLSRLIWVPVSFALVAYAGYETVRRLPLVWGAVSGATLAGAANVVSWLLGSWDGGSGLRFPDEAPPLLIVTSLLTAAIIGAIVGVAAGFAARGRRRHRARRSAIGKLAYTAYDEPASRNAEAEALAAMSTNPADRAVPGR